MTDRRFARHAPAARLWAASQAQPLESFLSELDAELWNETQEFARAFRDRARLRLSQANVSMGGGGAWPLLYFIVRHLRPSVVVETGVAAGWSSAAILGALEHNENGELHSSDFPYFRLEDPEPHIGLLVPPELKSRWHLYLKGDDRNLSEIARAVTHIDLVHYDSDKSYIGRRTAMERIRRLIHPGTAAVFDDIEDNFHFRDSTMEINSPHAVCEFEGKFVGIIGSFLGRS